MPYENIVPITSRMHKKTGVTWHFVMCLFCGKHVATEDDYEKAVAAQEQHVAEHRVQRSAVT